MKAKELNREMVNDIIDTARIMREIYNYFDRTDDGEWYTVNEYTVAYFYKRDVDRILKNFEKIKMEYFKQ